MRPLKPGDPGNIGGITLCGLTLSEYIAERSPLTLAMAATLGVMLAEALNDRHVRRAN